MCSIGALVDVDASTAVLIERPTLAAATFNARIEIGAKLLAGVHDPAFVGALVHIPTPARARVDDHVIRHTSTLIAALRVIAFGGKGIARVQPRTRALINIETCGRIRRDLIA